MNRLHPDAAIIPKDDISTSNRGSRPPDLDLKELVEDEIAGDETRTPLSVKVQSATKFFSDPK